MKTVLCFLFLLPTVVLFSQDADVKLSNALPNKFVVKNKSFSHNGKLYFFDSDGAYKENILIVNTENNQVSNFEQKKLTIDNFIVSLMNNKKHISDEHLYELAYCVNRKKLVNVSYAILKRNLNSISEVEKVLWLENFNLTASAFSYSTVDYSFFPGKSCFYIIRKSTVGNDGANNYIAKYNYDLEEVWKKDFSFTNEKGINVDYVNVNENDDLLVCIKMTEDVKGRWSFKSTVTVNKSGLFFYILNKDGEELGISPEIDQSIFFKKYDLRYYPEKKEVVGFFQINKLNEKDYTTYGNGYAYMKWDEEGSILTSSSHYFTIDELKNNEVDQYLNANKKDYNRFLNKNGEMYPISDNRCSIHFDSNQEVILGYGYNDKLFYKVNKHGELDWTYFMVTDGSPIDRYLFIDDVIYFCETDYAENFTSGKYKVSSKPKNPILSVRKIDAKTGELIDVKPIMNVPSDYIVYKNEILIDESKQLFVIEYRNTKKNSRKYLSYAF